MSRSNSGNARETIPELPGFGLLPKRFTTWKHSGVVVYSAPFGKTVSYQTGTEYGPEAILRASANLEWYDIELGTEPYRHGICTLPQPEPLAMASSPKMVSWVSAQASSILDAGKFPVLLGGEHAVSIGAIRAAAKRSSQLTVLSFDAHTDLRDRFNGSPLNHACVMRRVLPIATPVLAGIRSTYIEANRTIQAHKIAVFPAEEVLFDKSFPRRLLRALGPEVYVSIDLDVFDPAVMPATGTPEPGGLGWYDLLRLLRMVFEHRRVVAADVVELRPLEGNAAPDFLAAKLVYKLIGYKYASCFPGKTRAPAGGVSRHNRDR
ncbi:MAG: agmatinase [Verrucomicrobia bacterium]|nr:agmatinase [Verrucomicrobiota bacterium]